jgi:ADP-dependent NAD(P)H-hydrate dehydratase / NAD(P)H-hydrate epimerase
MNPDDSHPVLSCTEAKAWEMGRLKNERAEWLAMEQAGAALARAMLDDLAEIGGFPADGQVLVLAGKGHNGGDALLAARAILRLRRKARVTVVLPFGPRALRPLAGRALDRLKKTAPGRVALASAVDALAPGTAYALCLDGIFGFQFRLPLDARVRALLVRVNAHPGIGLRAAVDLPSGVGDANAPLRFRADFTYATGIVKKPVLSARVISEVGRLRYLDLGFFAEGAPAAPEQVLTTAVLQPLAGLRASQTDKRTFGHILIVGGSRSYPGAVMLATRAALRSGAGLVTAFVPKTLAPEYAAAHPEAMWVGCPETAAGGLAPGTLKLVQERLGRASALLIGPGLSSEPGVIRTIQAIVRHTNIPLVLDADALRADVVALLRDRPFVCTPHAGEFARIAPKLFVRDKFVARQGVLVLKGPMTRVSDGRTIYHSPFGGPVLARGGSGDILAGLVGGLLAQDVTNPLQAACRGVVWHGRAADLLARARGQVAVEITELLEHLGPALLSPTCPKTP